jgi:hypothetical protein
MQPLPAPQKITTIGYFMLRNSDPGNAVSRYQYQDKLEIVHLPFFHLLPLLPAAVESLVCTNLPFAQAMERCNRMPGFRQAPIGDELQISMREFIESTSIRVVILTGAMPKWLPRFAQEKPLVLLTLQPSVYSAALSMPGVHAVFLRGIADLPSIYSAIGSLLADLILRHSLPQRAEIILPRDFEHTLFSQRPRIGFIPMLRIPPPSKGKPAAFLLNRLSNNLEGITLDDEVLHIPPLAAKYEHIKQVCIVLGLMERGLLPELDFGVSRSELEDAHNRFMGDESEISRLNLLLDLGECISASGPRGRYLFGVPAIRSTDLKMSSWGLRRKRDSSPEEVARLHTSEAARIQSIRDFCADKERPGSAQLIHQEGYEITKKVLGEEQELIASQMSLLAGATLATPVLTPPRLSSVFTMIDDLQA